MEAHRRAREELPRDSLKRSKNSIEQIEGEAILIMASQSTPPAPR